MRGKDGRPIHTLLPLLCAQQDPIPAGQKPDVLRQVLCDRHCCVLHDDGNDRDLPLQRGSDFGADQIIFILQASSAALIFDGQPAFSDHHDHGAASGNLLGYVINEVDTQWHTVYVHEQTIRSVGVDKPIVKPTGSVLGILATVAQENSVTANPAVLRLISFADFCATELRGALSSWLHARRCAGLGPSHIGLSAGRSARCSASIIEPSQRIAARSSALRSSRTLPGQ
jgi:hypothetical protein